ncbi:PrsW family glutamic-type intramembrane protease [Methanopyrus sp.]
MAPIVAVVGALLGIVYAPISVVIAFLAETALTSGMRPGFQELAVTAVVVAPIVEELAKGLGFLVVPRLLAGVLEWSRPVLPLLSLLLSPKVKLALEAAIRILRECGRRPAGTVTIAATTALGFGAIENVFYALVGLKELGLMGPIVVGIVRTFTSLPVHVIATSSFGLLYGSLRRRWLGFALGYLTAVSIHAAFNFTAVYAKYKAVHGLIGT